MVPPKNPNFERIAGKQPFLNSHDKAHRSAWPVLPRLSSDGEQAGSLFLNLSMGVRLEGSKGTCGPTIPNRYGVIGLSTDAY